MHKIIKAWYSTIGRKGGLVKSKKKAIASRKNGRAAQLPAVRKVRHFLKAFGKPLIHNEWKFTIPLTIKGRKTTYNPDFFDPKTRTYIEVATSKSNIGEQGPKWRASLRKGLKLKIYWWRGNDITTQVLNQELLTNLS